MSKGFKMDIPEIKIIVDKLAHKKFFMVLTLQYVCLKIAAPGQWWWVPLVCATVVTLAAIVAQTYLDRDDDDPPTVL